jgi:uncharacterized protein with ATP-grasp and redox domains
MFFDPACIPCIINQSYNAAKLFTNGNKDLQLKIIKEACEEVKKVNSDFTAPLFAKNLQEIVEKNLRIKNPYKKIKEKNLDKAEKFIPYLSALLENSEDRIEWAVRIAAAGNIIDIGANPNFNILDEINKISSDNIDLSELPNFKNDLENSNFILYIGDNYEEALFDKFLLDELKDKRVVFAVRSQPILNDITLIDARNLGIDKICEVIESGSNIAGTNIKECTNEFMELYRNADMIIAKGQGNYETLLNEERPIYFLFKVKCEVISQRCGRPVGKGVLLFNQHKFEEVYETI